VESLAGLLGRERGFGGSSDVFIKLSVVSKKDAALGCVAILNVL